MNTQFFQTAKIFQKDERDVFDPRVTYYKVNVDDFYRVALDLLKKYRGGSLPIPACCYFHVSRSLAAGDDDFKWAGQPKNRTPTEKWQARGLLLESARCMLTALLHEAVGAPVNLKIYCNSESKNRWRL